jgi:hypothetical protein
MKPLASTGVIITAASVAVSFLTVCLPGAAAAQPSPSAGTPASGSAAWAYGALASKGWAGAVGTYPYKASETVGFAVVLSESAGPGENYTLHVNRTMGVLLSVEFCAPSCARAVDTATVDFHAWEVVHAVLELNTSGHVNVSGVPTPALALVSSNVSIKVGLRESTQVVADGKVVRGHNLSVDLGVNSSTAFTPALGLFPLSIASAGAETWTATSVFAEIGSGNWSVREENALGATTLDLDGKVTSLDTTGSVTVNGSSTAKTIRLGGANYEVVGLSVVGPFSLREGFLFLPIVSDLFGGTAPSWLPTASMNTSGSATVAQANVDVAGSPAIGSHLGFEGSDVIWNSGTANPAATVLGADLSPAVEEPQVTGSNATSLQGGPESLAQAATEQNCLASGVGCPSAGPSRGLPWELMVLGGGAAAVVLLAVVIAERRRLPPPAYPNSTLYPPGPASAGAPGGVRRPGAPAPPPDDDPLGHLW